jgi:hypothetical protein
MTALTWCKKHYACSDAIEWIEQEGIATMAEAWEKCQRSDWMLWTMKIQGAGDDKTLRLFDCRCVRDVWYLLADEHSRNAVEVAERYAMGDATDEELDAARADVWAAC